MGNEKSKNKLSLKAKSYKLKAVVMCFVAVIALVFLFVPTGGAYAQSCSCPDGPCPSQCTSAAAPVCVGWGVSACNISNPCFGGKNCVSGFCEGTCQAVFSSATAVGPFEIKPPTGTATFSDITCKIIDFFSNTILPPIAVLMMLVVGFLFMVGGQMPQKAIAARKTLLYVVAGVILLLLAPGIIGIVIDVTGASSASFTTCASPITTTSIVKTIAGLVNWFAWFVSITSVVMGLYAGALYLTARGDSSQVLKATKAFSYTIIGIAVAVVSFSIILLTRTLFGL